jgi:histidinol-phosphatase (PHP family)
MRDYHLHTTLCKHAEGSMEEYVEAAIEAGLTEICFTEHMPFPNGFDSAHRMEPNEMETYLEQIDRCRIKYREMSILVGIEADYIEGFERFIEKFLSRYSFDIVIMSVHFIKKWTGNEWVFDFEWTPQTLRQRYRDYFEALTKGIRTGLFDVVGHLDIVKRPKRPVMRSNDLDVDRALDNAKRVNMSVEINASGLRKPVNDFYPSMSIIELAVEKGIPLVLASDAHKPEHVGFGFDDMFNMLFNFPDAQLARYGGRKYTTSRLYQPDPD